MPDVSLGLSNSHLIEEYNFHPSVRLSRFAADRVVSFVPADGTFTLMTYKVRAPSNTKHDSAWRPKYIKPNAWAASQPGHSGGALASVSDPRAAQLPLYIRPQATFGATQGRVSIVCGTKPSAEKPVEAVRLEVRLPARTSFADPTSTHGVATYDDASHSVLWSIETFPKDKTPCLTVALNMEESEGGGGGGGGGGSSSEKTARARTVSLQEIVDVQATFAVKGVGVSGIKVESVQVRNEKYTPSQGVRYHTRGGRVVVRT
jgi:AP-3 complex subunit mu